MTSPAYRFGPFRFDAAAYRLLAGGRAVPLSPKLMDLLRLLASRPAELVTKDDILRELWPDVIVTDNAITQAVSDLRQALGDDAAAPSYVQTVPRRGYRFIAVVHSAPARAEAAALASAAPHRPAVRRVIGVADFSNVTGDPADDWMAAGIAETVTGDLRAWPDAQVLDRAHLPAPVRAASIVAARSTGLDLIVAGSVQRAGRRVRITARAIDTRSGEAVAHAKADGTMAEVFALQDAIGLQLLQTLAAADADRRLRVPGPAAAPPSTPPGAATPAASQRAAQGLKFGLRT